MRGWGALAKWGPFFDDGGANPSTWNPLLDGTSGGVDRTADVILADGFSLVAVNYYSGSVTLEGDAVLDII